MLLLAWLTTFAVLCGPVTALLPEAPKPLKQMPATSFTCAGKVVGGYYADVQAGCRVFHVCTLNEKGGTLDIPFLCVDGTVFDQKTRVCERVDEVDCSISESFYHLNNELYGPGIIPMTASESDGVEKPTTQHALDPTAALMGLAITSSSLPPSPAPPQESSTLPGASSNSNSNSNSPFTSPSFNSSSSTFFDFTSIPVEKQHQQQFHGVSSSSTVVSTSTSSSITTTLTPPDPPPFTISRTSSSTSVSSSSRVQIETPLAQISLDQGVDHSSLPAPHLRQTLLRLALQAQNAKVLSEHERAPPAPVTLDPPTDFEDVPRLSALSSKSSSHDPIGQPVVPPRQKRQTDPLKHPAANPVRISPSRLLRRPSNASPRPREAAAAAAAAVAAAPTRASARRPPRPRVRSRQQEGRERTSVVERPSVVERQPSSRRRVAVTRPSHTRPSSRAPVNRTPPQNAVDRPFRREFGPPDVPAAVQVAAPVATRPVHRARPSHRSRLDSDVAVDPSPLVPEAPFTDADPDLVTPSQNTTTAAPTVAPIVLPVTSFSCDGRVHGGLYADPEAGCELYHVCSVGPEGIMEDHRFLCGVGTLFDQVNRVCRAANEVNCALAPDFYYLNSNPLLAVIPRDTDFPEQQFDFPRVRERRHGEVLSTNQYLCDLLRKDEASGDAAVRCAFYFLCNTQYVQEFKQCENDLAQSGSHCLSQEAVQCVDEISGYQEVPYGVPESLKHVGGPLGRRRRSALPSLANLVVVPGSEDARVRRALFSLAALQLWVKENAMHSSFIDMQTIQMKNRPFVKKVESATGIAPESKIRVLTRLRRQLSDVRDSGDSSLSQAGGEGALSVENTTTSSTVAPTTTTPTTTTSVSSTTTPITPSPESQVTTEEVPFTSLGPEDDQLDVFAFTALSTLTKVTTPTTPVTTTKTETPSSISPPTIATPAEDPSVTGETPTSVPSSVQSLSSTTQDSTPSFVDTTTAVSLAKSASTQLPETSTSNDLPVEKKDQIDEAVDDAKLEGTPTLTTSTTSSTSATSTLATMSSLPSTSATPVNMIPSTTKATPEVTTVESQETSPVTDIDQGHTGGNDTMPRNTTESPLTLSVENTGTTEPLDEAASNSTEPTPSPDLNKYENGTDQDTLWNETSTPKPGQLFTRDNLPETSFTCKDKQLQKFYPDPEVNCQVFHYCSPGFTTDQVLDLKFLCTGPTMFDVKTQKCEDMEQVTCSKAELLPKEDCNGTETDKLGDESATACDNKTSTLDQNATAIAENVTSSAGNATEVPDSSIGSGSTNVSAPMITLDNATLPRDSSSNASIPSSENIINNQTTDAHDVHSGTSVDSTGKSNITVESSPHNETSDGGDSIHRNSSETDSVPLDTKALSNDSSHSETKVDGESIHNTTSSSADTEGELPDVGTRKQDTSSPTDPEEASSLLAKASHETTPINGSETGIPSSVQSSSEAPEELPTSTPDSTQSPPSAASQHTPTTEPNLNITSLPSGETGNLTEATNREDPVLTSDTVQLQEATEEVHDKKENQPTTEKISIESSKKESASVDLATTTEEVNDPANETDSGNETTTTSVPSTSAPDEAEKNTTQAPQTDEPQSPEEASDSGHESKSQPSVPTPTPSVNTSEELKSDLSSPATLDSTIKADSQNDTGSAVTGHEGQEASAPSPQSDKTRETVPELSQVDPAEEGLEKNSDKAKEQETISGSTSSGGLETVAGGASPEAPQPTLATAAESS